jgi:molybdopterin-guanine dinucleotide biosynthesis protein
MKSAIRNPQSAIKVVAIAGAASNVGKTTLLCDLLRELSRGESWEAIKLTRGHYRSCGRDPHACCVSDLLGDQPTIRSGRDETYAFGRDTGRYWDAGATNVHWLIATNDQVEQGIKQALGRVRSQNVLIEGTSFLRFIKANFTVLVVRSGGEQLKPSARSALSDDLVDAVYISGDEPETASKSFPGLPLYSRRDLPQLIECIRIALIPDS